MKKKDEHHKRQKAIANFYQSGKYTTTYIATTFGISTRQVQRIATQHGVVRTAAESNRVIAPLKRHPRIRKKPDGKKRMTAKLRYQLLMDNPSCALCRGDEFLQVDHIDEDVTNNELSNLQILCRTCNIGKSQDSKEGAR
jgi:5-methylcytosine-specific restriction endonuclease McrA